MIQGQTDRERSRDKAQRVRETQSHIERDTERHRDSQKERDRERQQNSERDRGRKSHRETDRDETWKDGNRDKVQTETQSQRETKTGKDKNREAERDRDIQSERQRKQDWERRTKLRDFSYNLSKLLITFFSLDFRTFVLKNDSQRSLTILVTKQHAITPYQNIVIYIQQV
jgi:hypothetical protein